MTSELVRNVGKSERRPTSSWLRPAIVAVVGAFVAYAVVQAIAAPELERQRLLSEVRQLDTVPDARLTFEYSVAKPQLAIVSRTYASLAAPDTIIDHYVRRLDANAWHLVASRTADGVTTTCFARMQDTANLTVWPNSDPNRRYTLTLTWAGPTCLP